MYVFWDVWSDSLFCYFGVFLSGRQAKSFPGLAFNVSNAFCLLAVHFLLLLPKNFIYWGVVKQARWLLFSLKLFSKEVLFWNCIYIWESYDDNICMKLCDSHICDFDYRYFWTFSCPLFFRLLFPFTFAWCCCGSKIEVAWFVARIFRTDYHYCGIYSVRILFIYDSTYR